MDRFARLDPVSIASLVLRFRRSEGESRQQIRWLAFIAVAVIASLLLALATRSSSERDSTDPSVRRCSSV